jgi:aerobic carbon-monoxide dehydrogenase large subunit
MQFGMGQAVVRKEDLRLLTGGGRYLDDINLPGQSHAAILRSPHAHARIRSVDSAAARKSPGVIAVFTGADIGADGVAPMPCLAHVPNKPGTPEQVFPRRMVLVADRALHVGDAVAMVVAESASAARDALAEIAVDYEPLPAAIDPVAALQPGAPQLWPEAKGNLDFIWADGDEKAVDAAFKRAKRTVGLDLVNNRVVVNSMEPRGAIGQYDAGADSYTLHTSSQGSHLIRDVLCGHIFKGLDPAKMRVVTPDVGGGFGMKVFVYAEMVLVLWAAKKLGRPVRWISDRSEAFISDSHGRDNVTRAELALDGAGRILAVRVQTTANLGAYLSQFGPYIPTLAAKGMQTGVYDIPAAYNEVKGVFTNTVPVDAYRGAGRPEAAYIVERLIDAAGRATGLGPVEIRRRNMIPPQAMPYTTSLGTTFDVGDFPRLLGEAVNDSDWDGFEARRREAKARGKLRGIGLAYYIETCGGGPSTPAMIRVEPDRTVTVIVGNQSNGQGHETAYAQIVSEQLGIAFEAVRVRQGDTALWAKGSFTGGSRALPTGGPSARYAADDAIAKGKEAASHLLETSAADIEYKAGSYRVVGTDRTVDLFAVAEAVRDGRARLASGEADLTGSAEFKPEASTYPNGCHICELEVDPDTGTTEIVRYTVVDDFGRVVNPLLLAGQVHGGIGQGVGQALVERTVYNDDGQLLTASFMDYAMPRADNLPSYAFRWIEIPCKTNPLGIKGSGEAGAIGAPPAVMNALLDALGPLGVAHLDMPATPAAVWQAIQAAGGTRKAAE